MSELQIWVCPDCGERAPRRLWAEDETPCATHGLHLFVICPRCERRFEGETGLAVIAAATRRHGIRAMRS